MNIDSVNSSNSGVYGINSKGLKSKYQEASSQTPPAGNVKSDKLELSDEAKKIQMLRARVEKGFYDNPEVIREVAIKLDREIPPSK